MVAPRIAALEAATMVKSAPVRPRRTSLVGGGVVSEGIWYMMGLGESLHGGPRLYEQ